MWDDAFLSKGRSMRDVLSLHLLASDLKMQLTTANVPSAARYCRIGSGRGVLSTAFFFGEEKTERSREGLLVGEGTGGRGRDRDEGAMRCELMSSEIGISSLMENSSDEEQVLSSQHRQFDADGEEKRRTSQTRA